MLVRPNGEALDEVDCFKQEAAIGGYESDVVHSINEGYRALVALKTVLNNSGLGINSNGLSMKEKFYQRRCAAEEWGMRSAD